MVIFTIIRIVYLYLAIMLVVCLFESKNIYQRMAFALVAMPFIMRALLLK